MPTPQPAPGRGATVAAGHTTQQVIDMFKELDLLVCASNSGLPINVIVA
jgi:hypothetical protein